MTSDPLTADATPSRTTLAMLAGEAGVSLSTVSKVLNGRSDVSPGTRVAVERLLDAHSYRRRGSSAHESTLIELVFSDIANPWGSEIVSGVQDVARVEGMSVLLTPTAARAEPGPDWLPAVMRRRPVGVLVVSTEPESRSRERLLSRNIPVVVIDPAGELAPGVPSVGSTNWNGGLAAARHLLELGHRDIAAVTGPAEMLCSHARLDGFRSAMSAAGVRVREEWVRWGDFQAAGGRLAAEAFLTGPGAARPTAVFAGNDVQALGVIEAAERLGFRVPQDLSVVGYDDTPVATWARPPLTTVHQPIRRMAAEATRIMLRLARGEAVPQPRLELATHLVVRGSTARRS